MEQKIMDNLLYLYDWYIRHAPVGLKGEDQYQYGYADAIGQCILDTGKILGEKHGEPYKYEAYKRVMEYDTTANYIKRYPKREEREL